MAKETPQEESLRSMTREPFVLLGDNTAVHDETGIQTSMTQEMCPVSFASPMNQETSMPQTKKSEPTTIRVFGATIMASPQETSEASYSPQAQNPTLIPRNEELQDEAKQVKRKRKYTPKEKYEEIKPDLPWTIGKKLYPCDIGTNSRFTFETKHVKDHILPHLSEDVQKTIKDGNPFKVKVYDEDTETEHVLFLKRYNLSSNSYVLNGGWDKEFVKRRSLKQGDVIEFFWNVVDSRLHFSVLSRAPADQNNPN